MRVFIQTLFQQASSFCTSTGHPASVVHRVKISYGELVGLFLVIKAYV